MKVHTPLAMLGALALALKRLPDSARMLAKLPEKAQETPKRTPVTLNRKARRALVAQRTRWLKKEIKRAQRTHDVKATRAAVKAHKAAMDASPFQQFLDDANKPL